MNGQTRENRTRTISRSSLMRGKNAWSRRNRSSSSESALKSWGQWVVWPSKTYWPTYASQASLGSKTRCYDRAWQKN
ncbi:unnamed protein product [Ectocarpus fasciculatus]